jgi:hypothetical protein
MSEGFVPTLWQDILLLASKLAQEIALMTCIREVTGSNLIWNTEHHD